MASVKWNNGTSPSNLELSWKATALKVLEDIPSTWNGYAVSILVNSTRGGSHSKKSYHYKGEAIDLNIILNGVIVTTGSITYDSKGNIKAGPLLEKTVKVNGNVLLVKDIYSELLGSAATKNGCRWGGNFGGGVYPKYDPMHFDSGSTKDGSTPSPDGDESFYVYSEMPPLDPGTSYTPDAGSTSKLDSGSAVVHTDNTILYIGYDLTLSDFAGNPLGKDPLQTILLESNVAPTTANKLIALSGLTGATAFAKYNENSSLTITEENADLILKNQVTALVKFLKESKGFDASVYPTQISTAITSYFFGKNLSTPENSTQVDEVLRILKSSNSPATELARYIETKSEKLSSDLQARRASEARLLRSYNAVASTSNSDALTSTASPSTYASNSDLLKAQLNNQVDEMKRLFTSRKSSSTDPASEEYDDTFNDIDQSTLDSIASIMQAQQVNSDLYFSFKDNEYLYRIKTKNFYSILARNLNTKISTITKMVESDDIFKDHKEYSIATMYSMIPYSTGMSFTIKQNAVRRCEYRIRLLELRIKNNESGLMSIGVPSTDSYLECGAFIATLPIRLGALGAVTVINSIEEFFGTLGVLREQLKLEKGNLARLKKDMNRYSG